MTFAYEDEVYPTVSALEPILTEEEEKEKVKEHEKEMPPENADTEKKRKLPDKPTEKKVSVFLLLIAR